MKVWHVLIFFCFGYSLFAPLKAFRAISRAQREEYERRRAAADAENKYTQALKNQLLNGKVGVPSYEDAMFDALIHDGFIEHKFLGVTRYLIIKDLGAIVKQCESLDRYKINCVLGHICKNKKGVALKEVIDQGRKSNVPITQADIDFVLSQSRAAALIIFFRRQADL